MNVAKVCCHGQHVAAQAVQPFRAALRHEVVDVVAEHQDDSARGRLVERGSRLLSRGGRAGEVRPIEPVGLDVKVEGFHGAPRFFWRLYSSVSESCIKLTLCSFTRGFGAIRGAVAVLTHVWPDAEVHPFEGMGHGEIVAHPQQMAAEIKRLMGKEAF